MTRYQHGLKLSKLLYSGLLQRGRPHRRVTGTWESGLYAGRRREATQSSATRYPDDLRIGEYSMIQQAQAVGQVLSWIVAVVVGLVAAFKAIHEIREGREQRERELNWNRVKLAHEMTEVLWNCAAVKCAIRMLQWKKHSYTLEDGRSVILRKCDVLRALRVDELRFTEEERYVRNCFADLFARLGRIEHFIKRGLIDLDDIRDAFLERAARFSDDWPIYKAFMLRYSHLNAIDFLLRFEEVSNCDRRDTLRNGDEASPITGAEAAVS